MALGTMGVTRDLGPAIVAWGSTTIAEIWEEVRFTLNSAEAGQVFEAIHGATPVDSIVSGYSDCEVSVPATRASFSVMAEILPGGSASGSSGVACLSTGEVGLSMYDDGLPLFVKPIIKGVAASNGTWLRLEHTYPQVNFDVVFNLRDQRAYGFTFKAHPDATSGKLWSAGKVDVGTSY